MNVFHLYFLSISPFSLWLIPSLFPAPVWLIVCQLHLLWKDGGGEGDGFQTCHLPIQSPWECCWGWMFPTAQLGAPCTGLQRCPHATTAVLHGWPPCEASLLTGNLLLPPVSRNLFRRWGNVSTCLFFTRFSFHDRFYFHINYSGLFVFPMSAWNILISPFSRAQNYVLCKWSKARILGSSQRIIEKTGKLVCLCTWEIVGCDAHSSKESLVLDVEGWKGEVRGWLPALGLYIELWH